MLVEKPLATTSADAVDLIEVAEERGVVLMPGHTFVYSPPVNKVRELIAEDVVGEVYFITSSRMNLGKYQADGVILDLAPHDLSILLYWLGDRVAEVSASGRSVFQPDVPETAFITLTFEGGAKANVQLSWLAPRKVRDMIVVGSRRMIQYDDLAADEAVRIYDRGLDVALPQTFGEHQLTYRSGDIVMPRLDAAEPLGLELADFARAIRTGTTPRSNAELGLEIVLAMEAAQRSLERNGQPVAVTRPDLPRGGLNGGIERGRMRARAPFRRPRAKAGPPDRCWSVEIAKALILAGRTAHDQPWPSVRTGPKHLVPVANQPILFHNLESLRRAGLIEATIALDQDAAPIRDAVGDGSQWGLTVRYVDWQPGSGVDGALAAAREFVAQEPLLVEPGDILHRELIHPHIAAFAREALDALALRVLPVTGATAGRGDGRRVPLQPARRRDAARRPRGRRSVRSACSARAGTCGPRRSTAACRATAARTSCSRATGGCSSS